MRSNPKRTLIISVTAVCTIALVALITLANASLTHLGGVPIEKLKSSLIWRAQIFLDKARGRLTDLSWAELVQMTRPGSGFSLESAVTDGRSLEAVISNPFVTQDDRATGAKVFIERCSSCHGTGATGGHGPPLNRPHYNHGDSDWAIHKVLRDGISGTAMAPTELSWKEMWQVAGYLRTLQLQSESKRATINSGPRSIVEVTSENLKVAAGGPDGWLTYSGNLLGWRHSALTELTPANVSQLRLRWAHQFSAADLSIQATPIVAGGTIFLTEPPSNIVALDARTGALRWKFERDLPADLPICCGRVNRGLAILGKTLFIGTLDAHLLAINADDGKLIWDVAVASPADKYSITSAPLIAGDSVVTGISGGDFGIQGFLAAYDATTGKERWRFHTIPYPGEPGHDTWKGDAWRSGGGATWVTGSYDPVLDLVYWGVGNPAPVYLGDARPGDNLFSNSVIALRATTGELAWYFQFSPHDEFDRDSAQTPILTDLMIKGISRRVVCWANRNGFYYVFDRVTGEFLLGAPFVEQNWTEGLNSNGRPTFSESTQNSNFGRLIRPGIGGGTNWQPPSFDPATNMVFVPATEGASVFTKSPLNELRRGQRGLYVGSGFSSPEPLSPVIRALDAATGAKKWEYFSPPIEEFGFTGLLSTAGGVLMGASGGYLFALDVATGREVWRVFLGGNTRAPPISFELDGHQMVAVCAGQSLFLFNL